MSERKVGPIAKELIAAKKRIENPENWCAEGTGDGFGRDGHRVCAILATVGNNNLVAEWLVPSAQTLFGTCHITQVNATGHSAVMQLYDHDISKALSEGV